jgi:5'-methylthioinosine phosphorylase
MTDLAVIGGTGLTELPELQIERREVVTTPWGAPSGPLTHGLLHGRGVVFLARHGYGHNIPPHKVNYRANLWALRAAGAARVLAVAAVGGIRKDMQPGRIAFPDQVIDYTSGRAHTYFEDDLEHVTHVDFTQPYDEGFRAALIAAARRAGLDAVEDGTYGAAQGPRLESKAEIDRMERDGCALVGMTGMPETALARELELAYASCAVVANRAAGRNGGADIHSQIALHLDEGMARVRRLLAALLPAL